MAGLNTVAESNDYGNLAKEVDVQSQKDLEKFKNYYNNATKEKQSELNGKFQEYLEEELQKDTELKDKLKGDEIKSSEIENIKESSEITEQDIENLNTVRNLIDVLDNYPDISSPEYRALKRIINEHIEDLTVATKEILANSEH